MAGKLTSNEGTHSYPSPPHREGETVWEHVYVNGKKLPVPPDTRTIGDLLRSLGLSPDTVVIEYNEEVLPRDAWERTAVKGGDHVEILSFVGGG